MTRWKCRKCSYIYDPRVGDPDGGIPPGTPFEQIPDSWRCPVCGVTKRDFYSLGSPQTAATARSAQTAATARSAQPTAASLPSPAPRPAAPPGADSAWTVGSLKRR